MAKAKQQFMAFVETEHSDKRLTKRWNIHSRLFPNSILGQVRWHPSWRKYCMFPAPGTLFDAGCLGEVILFIENEMKEHYRRGGADTSNADYTPPGASV